MLDGLLSRGFSSKCKSLIKANRARIEVVRRRAEAKQRFLKEDLAKLLSNGLDINAYGRTEEYIAGMNLLSCYGFIELSCEYIVKHLSGMQKRGDCPEECRQAVASLMFAAARFSDLPELRELRDIFQERYGSNLEVFVNQKFVENLSPKSPATANKLRVLEDIASEFAIKWDSRGFELRMASPIVAKAHVDIQKAEIATPMPVRDEKYRKHSYGDGYGLRKDEVKHDIAKRKEAAIVYDELPKRGETSSAARNIILFEGSHFHTRNKIHNEKGGRDNTERLSSSSNVKMLEKYHAGDVRRGNEIYIPREKAEVKSNFAGLLGKTENPIYPDHHRDSLNSQLKDPPQKSDKSKGSSSHPLPPPYVKSKDNITLPPYIKPIEDQCNAPRGFKCADENDPSSFRLKSLNNSSGARNESHATRENNEDLLKPHSNYALPPPYVKSKDKIVLPPYKDIRNKDSGVSEHSYDSSSRKDNAVDTPPVDEGKNIPLSRPRSMRRKHHKSSGYDIEGSSSTDVNTTTTRRSSSSRRKEEKHHQRDDEERIIDKLLIHYSKKPSNFDEEKVLLRKKFPGEKSDAGELEVVTRSVSLPHKVTTALPELKKVLNRVNTFQPDNAAKHVHPKLPDYDDIAARFNALKGR